MFIEECLRRCQFQSFLTAVIEKFCNLCLYFDTFWLGALEFKHLRCNWSNIVCKIRNLFLNFWREIKTKRDLLLLDLMLLIRFLFLDSFLNQFKLNFQGLNLIREIWTNFYPSILQKKTYSTILKWRTFNIPRPCHNFSRMLSLKHFSQESSWSDLLLYSFTLTVQRVWTVFLDYCSNTHVVES